MAIDPLIGDGVGGAFIIGQKWKALLHAEKARVALNLLESRLAAVEVSDVSGPSSSVASEIALYDGTTGKLIKRATGTGYVKVVSGVYQAPVATVPLATDVSGDLPFANLAQGAALSVLGVTGNATADVASIAAGSDGQVLRRSGTSVGFGAVNLANANAITGALPLANLPTNFAQIFRASGQLNDAQIKALPTSDFMLVAAPASGFIIEPIIARIYAMTSAGAYTNINAAASLTIDFSGHPFPVMGWIPNDAAIGIGGTTLLTDFLGSTSRKRAILVPFQNTEDTNGWGPLPFVTDHTSGIATALVLSIDNGGDGNLTGGNIANVLYYSVDYAIVATP
jgi:hypothetical protein